MGNVWSKSSPPSPQSTHPTVLYKTSPPSFGHRARALFGFEPNYVSLSLGSSAFLPLPVRAFCEDMTNEIASNPDKFMKINRVKYITRVRERIAKFIGAEMDEFVLVLNTSVGITTVLRNFVFSEGDIIVGATTAYRSVFQSLQYLSDTPPYPTLSTFNIQFPTKRAQIIHDFEKHIKKLVEIEDPTGKRKIVVLIDAITSRPGLRLPWKEMVAICRDAGVISVVDGAHTLGQEPDLNLSEMQPDFFITDCHKWFYAKRPSAILYVPKRNHHFIRSPIPTPASYRSLQEGRQDFVKLFDYNGAADHATQLSVGAAIDFREWLGGEHKINGYLHPLAIEGGKRMAERLGTSVMDPDGDMTLNIVVVELPLPGEIDDTDRVQKIFVDTLILKWNTYTSAFKHNGRWWVRCSVQIWNELSDFDLVADALEDACARVKEDAAQKDS